MPNKRKSRRTHIFQRSTRSTRSRTKKSSSRENVVLLDENEVNNDESVSKSDLGEEEQEKEEGTEEEHDKTGDKMECEEIKDKVEVDHSNKYDIADIHVQVGIDEHTKKITETNIENRNGNPKSTLPVLVYRHKRISRRSHHYKSYSHEMLVAAYKCVKELKMPVKTAARVFGVPSSTLHNRVQGQVQIDDSIISLEDIHKIVKRLKKGDNLEDVFSELNYERAHGHTIAALRTEQATKEDSSNDDSITESILQKMNAPVLESDNPDIKEEVLDPEYENLMNESGSSTSDLYTSADFDNSELIPSPAERMKRAYKRNYKTYSYEQLVAAYLYVKEKKVAVKFAARAFGVPPSTLNDRVQGKVFIDTSIVMNNPKGRKILPQPSFNKYKVLYVAQERLEDA